MSDRSKGHDMLDAKKISNGMWFFVFVAGLCGIYALGAYLTYRSALLVIRGETATARCTRIEQTTSGSGENRRQKTVWHVSYPTADGTLHSGTIDASFRRLKTGDEIEVLYDPNEPGLVQANSFVSLWGLPLLFGLSIPLIFATPLRKEIARLFVGKEDTD